MKTIVVLSGGLDSTTLLYKLKKEAEEVKAISFNYGQKHKKELKMAEKTCEALNIDHEIVDLSDLKKLMSKSSLVNDKEIPKGHYEDETMKSTVVSGRNLIMASIAASYAVNCDFDSIALGVHAGDHSIYPDCRIEFITKLKEVLKYFDYKKIRVLTPFVFLNKAEIVKQGILDGVDFNKTWTCYVGGKEPCGKCGSCVERAEAFELNNKKDPLK